LNFDGGKSVMDKSVRINFIKKGTRRRPFRVPKKEDI
jgi:hypothetical protein